jgi:dihydroorotate dehydrogenase electron transfer subunit
MIAVQQSGLVLERSVPMRGAVELAVQDVEAASRVKPGQFFQIAVGAPSTLLRRPYSAAWTDPEKGHIGFIFNVVGEGSAWLAEIEPGRGLDLLGPLGHGFDLDGRGLAICVAGGLGVAVFPGVVKALLARQRPVVMLIGARTAEQLLPGSRFSGADVRVATGDGSAGHHGSVVDLLQAEQADIFTCGPTPMLQALIARARALGIPLSSIQIALETPMGCGVGTCLGCAVPRSTGGYLLACQAGPCISAEAIDWSRAQDAFHE